MKRRTLVIVVAVILLASAVVWCLIRPGGGTNPNAVQTVTVERGTVALTVSADGVLRPLTTVAVKSYAGGGVDVLAVEVGDEVKAGQLIAKIDPTDTLTTYDQAIADLTTAQARLGQALDQARVQPALTAASIAQAEAGYNATAKDLQRLQDAAHPQARAQARAGLDKAKANLDVAEKELARTRELEGKGFVAESELDAAVNRRDLAKAELESAQEQWDTLEGQLKPDLESAEARVAQAAAALDRARVDAVQDRLKEADVASAKAQVARAQAQVDNARTMLEYTTITAPRNGVILQKYVEEGTIVTSGRSSVTQGTDIVLLGDLTEMFVEVSLDEADVGLVKAGQPAGITVDAIPGERFEGRIKRVDPQAVTEQNVTTVLVTVKVDAPDARLKPGMTASCDFLVRSVEDVLRLPNRAVQRDRGEQSVLVQRDGELTQIPLEVGLVGDEWTEIRGGLAEGDVVVSAINVAGSAPPDRALERGRRMGGAGGFIREGG